MSGHNTNAINERVLHACHSIYTKPDTGLVTLASNIDNSINLLVPRKKISVLLIGNHSAGKSSFINWYIDEHIQKTGVAIETQGFTIITSGKKRETLTGNATLHLYPHFKKLVAKVPPVLDHLTTEVSTSKCKKFNLVNLIDSPGLVDGEMKYPFDINKSILWWANLVDLVFVFFDPIGQALCKRTLDICDEMASNGYREKMRFYLSKADEAGHEADRQRVMMQVVQELCKRPSLNTHSFDMPTIFVPTLNSNRSKCINQIELACVDIENMINLTIQNTLNQMQIDSKKLENQADFKLKNDEIVKTKNFNRFIRKFFFYSIAFTPILMIVFYLIILSAPKNNLINLVGSNGFNVINNLQIQFSHNLSTNNLMQYFYIFLISIICFILGKYTSNKAEVLTKTQKRTLLAYKKLLSDKIIKQKEHLYSEYLQQSISTSEL